MKKNQIRINGRGMNRVARRMKDSEGHPNNPAANPVISGQESNPAGEGNNAGAAFDPVAFWADPEDSNVGPPGNGNSAGDSSGSSGTTLGQTLEGRITGFEIKDVFTPAILEEMGEGNFEGVHKAFGTAIQQAMTLNQQNTVELLGAFGTGLVSKMQQMIDGKFKGSDEKKALHDAIPSAKDPRVGPMVEGLYDKALGIAKGDTKAAIVMTKEMMKLMASETSRDVGLSVAPKSGDSETSGNIPSNWLESLMTP